MKRLLILTALLLATVVAGIISCTHKGRTVNATPDDGNYPADVAKIITNKCVTSGCHNQASYKNAAGLLLDTWGHMLDGSLRGAQVVAYSPQFSTLLYYLNTDSSLGPVINDIGHIETPLTKAEYTTLYNWIAKGAPDKHGNIPFAAAATTRQKLYLNVQGCNLIAVIDAKSKLVMRYIPVGSSTDKTPHVIRASQDGQFAYVPFYNGGILQKLDMQTDTVSATLNIAGFATGGVGNWSSMVLSPLDTALLVSGWINNGCIVAVNTNNMQRIGRKSIDLLSGITSLFPFPHGVAANITFDTFYATLQHNLIRYAFSSSGVLSYNKIILAPGAPHEIEMVPDHSKYFVTCPRSAAEPSCKQVRVYDAHTDTLLRAFEVGTEPKEMALAPSRNLLFVTCMEDGANPQVNRRGSVYVFNYSTLTLEKILYGDFFQPHGIAVDEQNGLVFIPSRNADPAGPAPHHSTSCSGRPGWYSVYNLNTLQPADNKRYDVPSDPYSIATRFR